MKTLLPGTPGSAFVFRVQCPRRGAWRFFAQHVAPTKLWHTPLNSSLTSARSTSRALVTWSAYLLCEVGFGDDDPKYAKAVSRPSGFQGSSTSASGTA